MSAMQQTDGEGPLAHRHNRKLAVARHAHGSNAMGWILLGFVLGAGAAIAVLMNADFVRRGPAAEPAIAVRAAAPLRFAIAPVAPQPAVIAPPAPAPAFLGPFLAPKTSLPASPKAPAGVARKPAAVPEPVAEDAAAAGMTSRVQGRDSDLY